MTDKILMPLLCNISPRRAVIRQYRQALGRKPELDNPVTFNEKLCWLKLYSYKNDTLVGQCADKYAVMKYVEEAGYGRILKKLYGVYDRVDDIDFDALPQSFVLKFNKGADKNIICCDKSKLEQKEAVRTMKKWFREDCGKRSCEFQYVQAKPKIICEEYIGDADGTLPVDYKINCFNGEPRVTRLCTKKTADDNQDHPYFEILFVDNEYKKLDYNSGYKYGKELPPKPAGFDEMIEIARKLSAPFPFVRVDLYYVREKIYFGELTFTSCGGYVKSYSDEAQIILGDYLVLPKK